MRTPQTCPVCTSACTVDWSGTSVIRGGTALVLLRAHTLHCPTHCTVGPRQLQHTFPPRVTANP